uniref:hypothetical protein n=1 Tax=Nocardia aurea TaxID=2144174 RepID=UPI0018E5675A
MSRRTLTAGLTAGLAVATTLTVTTVPVNAARQPSVKFPSAKFPLGVPAVPTRTMTGVAQGIELYDVKAGRSTDGYTVTVLMPSGRDYGMRPTAEAKLAEVEATGEVGSLQKVVRPPVADAPAQEVYMVRVGLWKFEEKAKADDTAKKLKDAGLKVKVDYLGDDGLKTTGPWNVKVMMIDPRAVRGSYAA